MSHSPLGGSVAKRFMNCPGSVELCKKAPVESPSKYAFEGTAAHTLGERILALGITGYDYKNPEISIETVRGVAGNLKNREFHNEEMYEHVKLYVDTVRGYDGGLSVEQTVNLDWLYPGMWGTCDAAVAKPFGRLVVIDFKYGQGIAVEVKDNPQLLYYALATAKSLNMDFTEVEIVVVQPRIDHPDGKVRGVVIPIKELYEWGKKVLLPAAKATARKNAPLKCGEWCRFCQAQGICPEKRKEIIAVTQVDFAEDQKSVMLKDPDEMTTEELAKIYNFSSAVGPWCASVKNCLLDRLKKGKKAEGVKLVRGKSNRKWINESNAKAQLLLSLGDQVLTKPKLKTPAQVDKVAKTKEAKETVNALWTKPEAGLTIAASNDPRKGIQANSAINDFIEDMSIFK